jgi:hypothetical protein
MGIYIFTSVFLIQKYIYPRTTPLDNGSYENFNENSFELNFQSNLIY